MSRLFEPLHFGPLRLENRIVIAPMCQYSAEDGCASDWHMIHLGHLALSGAGLLTLEATAVLGRGPHHRLGPRALQRRQRGRARPGARARPRARRRCRSRSSWRMPGARPRARRPGTAARRSRPTSPTAGRPSRRRRCRMRRARSPPVALDRAGLDASATTSPTRPGAPPGSASTASSCTARTATCCTSSCRRSPTSASDAYGGSLENRMRFPLEVFDAVRDAFPAERPVWMRVSATDWVRRRLGHRAARSPVGGARRRAAAPPSTSPAAASRRSRRSSSGPATRCPTPSASRPRSACRPSRSGLITEPEQAESDPRQRRGRCDLARPGHALRPALAVACGGQAGRAGRRPRSSTGARSPANSRTCSSRSASASTGRSSADDRRPVRHNLMEPACACH